MRYAWIFGICLLLGGAQAALAQPQADPRLMEQVSPTATLQSVSQEVPELAEVIDALTAEARAAGSVRVVAKTAVPFAPDILLTQGQKLVQRADIAAAALKLRLAMPQVKEFSAMSDMPYVAMTLSPDDLARLMSVPGVIAISGSDAFNWRRDFIQLRVSNRAGKFATEARAPALAQEGRAVEEIVGGQDADAGVHPFQVGLLTKSEADNFYAQFCGGTLVADKYVVTAAHCSDTIVNPANDVQVLVGTQRLDGSGQRIDVSRVSIHPNWNANTNDYDVAVWELATPVSGIAFASLASTQPTTAGMLLRVTGWGSLRYRGSYPIMLQQVDVPYVPTVNGRCQSQGGITGRMICAGTTGKDSCQGDSGGPLTMDTGSGYTVLAGIVSFGNGCASRNYPGVYTNVAESSIRGFIENVLAGILPPPKTIQFRNVSQSIGEGGGSVVLTLERSNTSGSASVRYATRSGTASTSSDFQSKSGTVSFSAGRATATVSISIVNNRVREPAEQFTVTLSSPSAGWTLGANNTATVTIIDND